MNDRVVTDNRLSQISTGSSTNSKRAKAHIGPWQLGRTLGRGSSGRVRLAKHMDTGKLAAVKIVSKAQSTEQGSSSALKASESFGIEREVIIMKLIEHPNIMALYDVWENKGELYLVLEYIEGGELFDYLISRGRLSEREAIHYFRQICYGVDHCHRFNICHRDLKPENLLLDKHRNIKIADFGMAALESNDRLLETSCGSPHYASPEIVSGQTYHGAPSDIWSCGIILFALLSGHLPFDDDNIRQLLLKVQAGKYTIPSSISAEARDLISKMLIIDPKARITMREILAHPLLMKYTPRRIPAENTARKFPKVDVFQPIEHIDREILRNLLTLWRHDTKEEIMKRLRDPEPNAEKTFYSLLLRFRQSHGLASREPIPRNKSAASIRSIRSSKSVRSIASLNSKRGSMKSLKSVRSNRSGRSLLSSRRPRRSPIKQMNSRASALLSDHQNIRNHDGSMSSKTNHNESATVFAQLLDEAFNRNLRAPHVGGARYSPPGYSAGTRDNPKPYSDSQDADKSGFMGHSGICANTARRLPNLDSNSSSYDGPGKLGQLGSMSPRSHLPKFASSVSSSGNGFHQSSNDAVQSLSLDFDFSGHSYASPSETAHNYLLPMIFEEDRFADAIEEEVELKVYRQDTVQGGETRPLSTAVSASKSDRRDNSGGQTNDNSQLHITNLVAGESFLSYQPSAAAAAIGSPRRPAPPTPASSRALSERKPVFICQEADENALKQVPALATERKPLATIALSDLTKSRGLVARTRNGNNAQSAHTKAVKPQASQLHVSKRGAEKGLAKTTTSKSSSADTATSNAEKSRTNWIRRLTPRIVSRKSSSSESPSSAQGSAKKRPNENAATPAGTKPKFDDRDKENILPCSKDPAVTKHHMARKTKKVDRRSTSNSEELHQNWFMKLLSSPSPVTTRSIISTRQPIELRAIILEILSEWMPYGLALYSDGVHGDPIIVAVLQNNSLHLKTVRIVIDIKPSRPSAAVVKLVLQKGSRSSYFVFADELERRLRDSDGIGVY